MSSVAAVVVSFVVVAVYFSGSTIAVPVSVVGVEETEADDDSTTHTLERLSSAATCLVAGVEYTHGQQVYREDPCEFCLCLDGEMFCWWQDCPPTLEGPCRERTPYSPCLNGPRSPIPKSTKIEQLKPAINEDESVERSINETNTEEPTSEETTENNYNNNSSESPERTCVIMGTTYQIGESLPHDTGNCVECICGPGAQVACSPHQCAPADNDISFQPSGRQSDAF